MLPHLAALDNGDVQCQSCALRSREEFQFATKCRESMLTQSQLGENASYSDSLRRKLTANFSLIVSGHCLIRQSLLLKKYSFLTPSAGSNADNRTCPYFYCGPLVRSLNNLVQISQCTTGGKTPVRSVIDITLHFCLPVAGLWFAIQSNTASFLASLDSLKDSMTY